MRSDLPQPALRVMLASLAFSPTACTPLQALLPWPRQVIDSGSRGADGTRRADVNGDGHLDVITGWEEGGQIRLAINPGPTDAAGRWPAVTVGQVGASEDAVPFARSAGRCRG